MKLSFDPRLPQVDDVRSLKTRLTQMYREIAGAINALKDGILGEVTDAGEARTALGFDAIVGTAGAVSFRNKLINGGAEVAQRGAPSLTTSAQYGQVDRCAIWASGGAVSAGTITQVTSASVGRTGKAARAAGVTLTGSGVLSWRYRMEAADAVKLNNQTSSFQIAVMHNVGSNVNYTIIIRKPTAADNYASTTVINTGSATAVVTGTAMVLKSEGVALGDCSNGLEIEVQATCGAVTNKNFDFAEWQFEEGATATTFERRDFQEELRKCQRYFWKSYAQGTSPAAITTVGAYLTYPDATTSFAVVAQVRFPVPMLRTPTVIMYSPGTGATGKIRNNDAATDLAATAAIPSDSGVTLHVQGVSVATSSTLVVHATANAEL